MAICYFCNYTSTCERVSNHLSGKKGKSICRWEGPYHTLIFIHTGFTSRQIQSKHLHTKIHTLISKLIQETQLILSKPVITELPRCLFTIPSEIYRLQSEILTKRVLRQRTCNLQKIKKANSSLPEKSFSIHVTLRIPT